MPGAMAWPARPEQPDASGRLLVIPARPVRVSALIIAIVLVSLADLALTLTFLTSVGMAEANPLARAVIGTGSVAAVVGFKLVLSAVAVGILWLARRSHAGEMGAWAGALIMGWLLIRWDAYISQSHVFTVALQGNTHVEDHRWVALGE